MSQRTAPLEPTRTGTPAAPRRVPAGRVARDFRPGDPRRRIRLLLTLALVLISVVAVRVVELQTIQGPALAAAAEKDRTRTEIVAPIRGAILDRNMAALALTLDTRDVVVDQTQVVDPAATAEKLAPVLRADVTALTARLTGNRRFVYVAKGISPAVWDVVQSLALPGIFSQASSGRAYPAGDVAANVVGFVGGEGRGLAGLEYGYDSELAGAAGTKQFETSARGQEIPTAGASGTTAQPGLGLVLTLDRDLQYQAQQVLAAEVRKSRSDSGTVVVMDPATGQILALATEPSFDANAPQASSAADRANRAVADSFEPGSTAKLMTMAAALDRGVVNAGSRFGIPSSTRGSSTQGLHRGGHTFHDSETHGPRRLTATGVLAKSSNIGAILVSERVGGAKMYGYLKAFGVGNPTGLRFPGESRGFVPSPLTWSTTTFPTLAFGQGMTMNAVQAASVYSTIANDGVRVAPSLVSGYVRPDGSRQPAADPTRTRVVSAVAATTLRAMLESVVSADGTAPQAAIPGYVVAGKTGTANRVNPACSCYLGGGYTASFIGMAPADHPRLVVAVIMSNPKRGHYGSTVAAPVFRSVMTAALVATHTAPGTARRAALPVEW